MDCTNCLCHLKICKAECCKRFTINIKPEWKYLFVKNKVVRFYIPELSEDLAHYFKLHGCKIVDKDVVIHCHDFELKENKVVFNHRCMALLRNNTCSLHGYDSQPQICHYPNSEVNNYPGIEVTENCVYTRRN